MRPKVLKQTASILSGMILCSGSLHADRVVKRTTTYEGTVSTLDPKTSALSIESGDGLRRYIYDKKTVFLDTTGRTVTYRQIQPGVPVTVYYEPVGEQMIVRRVQLREPIAERVTTTTTIHERHEHNGGIFHRIFRHEHDDNDDD